MIHHDLAESSLLIIDYIFLQCPIDVAMYNVHHESKCTDEVPREYVLCRDQPHHDLK
jgi:hypothetical protein